MPIKSITNYLFKSFVLSVLMFFNLSSKMFAQYQNDFFYKSEEAKYAYSLTEYGDDLVISGAYDNMGKWGDFVHVLNTEGKLIDSLSLAPDSVESYLTYSVGAVNGYLYAFGIINPELGSTTNSDSYHLVFSKINERNELVDQKILKDPDNISNLLPRHKFIKKSDTLFMLMQHNFKDADYQFGYSVMGFDDEMNVVYQSKVYRKPETGGAYLGIGGYDFNDTSLFFSVENYPYGTEIYKHSWKSNEIEMVFQFENIDNDTLYSFYDASRGLWWNEDSLTIVLDHVYSKYGSGIYYDSPVLISLNFNYDIVNEVLVGKDKLTNDNVIGEGLRLENGDALVVGVDSAYVVYEPEYDGNSIFISRWNENNPGEKLYYLNFNNKIGVSRLFKSRNGGVYILGYYKEIENLDNVLNYFVIELDEEGNYLNISDNLNGMAAILYPNPAQNYIQFELPFQNTEQSYLYQILTSDGKVVASGEQVVKRIDIQDLPKGNYILRVNQSKGEKFTSRFVVE